MLAGLEPERAGDVRAYRARRAALQPLHAPRHLDPRTGGDALGHDVAGRRRDHRAIKRRARG
jgi:hypothetical protein